MKKNKIIVISILILVTLYFVLDRQLFYYGKNDIDIYKSLPLKIKPENRLDFEGGFSLEDEYGFSLISKGECQYVHSEIKLNVKEIINYGYNDETLIVFIEDESGSKYFIEFLKNNDIHSKQDISVNIQNESTSIDLEKFKWIEIKNNESQIRKLELFRNYTLIIISISILILIFKLGIRRKKISG